MKAPIFLGWSSALCLGAAAIQAQETNEIEQLRKQLKEATENFQKASEQYRQTIDAIHRRLEALQPGAAATNAVAATAPLPGQEASKPAWSPAEPIKLMGGQQNFLN